VQFWAKYTGGEYVREPFAMDFTIKRGFEEVTDTTIFTEFNSSEPPLPEVFDVPSECRLADKKHRKN